MGKRKAITASLIAVSLAGTLTLTAFAAKANFTNVSLDGMNIGSTLSRSLKNLAADAEDTDNEISKSIKKPSGIRIGGFINTDVICEILGITSDELTQQLKDSDGNIFTILEESGKLEEYKSAVLAKYKESLDQKVADGKLTQEQSDTMYTVMKDGLEDFSLDGSTRFSMWIGDETKTDMKAFREELKSEIESFKSKIPDRMESLKGFLEIDGICEVLGMTKEELSQKLEQNDGNIFKILEESDKLDEYKTAALDEYKASLEQKVADGKLTQEKADTMYTAMKERLDNLNSDIKINFHIDTDGIRNKIKEHFNSESGDFTVTPPEIDDSSDNKGHGKGFGSDKATQGI